MDRTFNKRFVQLDVEGRITILSLQYSMWVSTEGMLLEPGNPMISSTLTMKRHRKEEGELSM